MLQSSSLAGRRQSFLSRCSFRNHWKNSRSSQSIYRMCTIGHVAPRPEDVSTIDGMIKAYYEVVSGPAGQPRQWDRDATLYIPNVRFIIVSEDATGKTTAESMTHQEFVDTSECLLDRQSLLRTRSSSRHPTRR